MNEDKYMSSADAATLLGVSPQTITAWIRRGYLQGSKIGPAYNSPYKVLRSSVEEKLPEEVIEHK